MLRLCAALRGRAALHGGAQHTRLRTQAALPASRRPAAPPRPLASQLHTTRRKRRTLRRQVHCEAVEAEQQATAGGDEVPLSGTPPAASTSTLAKGSETTCCPELAILDETQVTHVQTGTVVDAGSVLREGRSRRVLLPLLTQFGDFDSWELAQKLIDRLPELESAGIEVVAIGIGSLAAARKFSVSTGFPMSKLYADGSGKAAMALGFRPGCGRKGGELDALDGKVNGYVKLLLMCAGIGSPGTLQEVFRGYLGDKSAPPVFKTGSAVDLEWKRAFDVIGYGYQRPFELATLRLMNMTTILTNRETLMPKDSDLLVQRGGVLLFQRANGELSPVWRYDDPGILGYASIDLVMEKALAEDPSAFDPVDVLHRVAASNDLDASEVTKAMKQLEKAKEKQVPLEALNGQWQLRFTTGNSGGKGSYFPLKAVQTFDVETSRIRNNLSLGPLGLRFDGGFIFDDNMKMLEFVFESLTVETGLFRPLLFKLSSMAWLKLKAREEEVSGGRGNIKAAQEGKRGSNPFFKFILADAECCAARGRGGGLAVWKKISDEPGLTDVKPGTLSKIGENEVNGNSSGNE